MASRPNASSVHTGGFLSGFLDGIRPVAKTGQKRGILQRNGKNQSFMPDIFESCGDRLCGQDYWQIRKYLSNTKIQFRIDKNTSSDPPSTQTGSRNCDVIIHLGSVNCRLFSFAVR